MATSPTGGAVTFTIPGNLTNPLNGSWGGWAKHARIARDWRNRTSMAVYVEAAKRGRGSPTMGGPRALKRVTFTVLVGRLWDTDNLAAAVKPIRDGLVDAGLIHADGPTSGHQFVYQQRVQPKDRGVEITIEPLPERSPDGE